MTEQFLNRGSLTVDQEQLITRYLADETLLYQEWFKTSNQLETEPNAQPIAGFPSLPALKERFTAWFAENENRLRAILCQPNAQGESRCQQWRKLRERADFHEKQHLIIAISVDIMALFIHPLHGLIVATILYVGHYLDKLCDCSKTQTNVS